MRVRVDRPEVAAPVVGVGAPPGIDHVGVGHPLLSDGGVKGRVCRGRGVRRPLPDHPRGQRHGRVRPAGQGLPAEQPRVRDPALPVGDDPGGGIEPLVHPYRVLRVVPGRPEQGGPDAVPDVPEGTHRGVPLVRDGVVLTEPPPHRHVDGLQDRAAVRVHDVQQAGLVVLLDQDVPPGRVGPVVDRLRAVRVLVPVVSPAALRDDG